jgi:hypothetical protein
MVRGEEDRHYYGNPFSSASALITLTERVAERNLTPMSYIIVEVLFGFILQLPSPPQVPIYYASVFIELCKSNPDIYPRIVSWLLFQSPSCHDDGLFALSLNRS